jgi:anthranilate phosphoribosyltransferase
VQRTQVDPGGLGLTPAVLDDLPGGDPAENARLAEALLAGEHGPVRDIVLMNAAAGLVVAGVVDELADGVIAAADAIDDGRAAAVLERLRAVAPLG